VQRFYLEVPIADGETEVALPSPIARQVATVLRMHPGDALTVFDGTGREWPCRVAEVARSGVRVTLGTPFVPAREPARRVTLCQALLKADKMEWVLQKGTELGVTRFEPLVTERVVASKRQAPERWHRILVEATEQCGRTHVPELTEPAPLDHALRMTGPSVCCWEGEGGRSLAAWLAAARPSDLRLFIGPEGGFSDAEADLARQRGAVMASLGPRILRAETAAIAATTLALLAS
jgi:16S rRNA (uracil1498-N3)-methyltransferase